MLTATIVTNDAEQLWIQVSPVVVGVTDYQEVPDGILWSEKTERELSEALKAGVIVLDDHLIGIYIERSNEKDRPTEIVLAELSRLFNVSRAVIEVELAETAS